MKYETHKARALASVLISLSSLREPAYAATLFSSAYSTSDTSQEFSRGYTLGNQISSSLTLNAESISVDFNSIPSTTAQIGIFSDSLGFPASLIASTAVFDPSTLFIGQNFIPLMSPIVLIPGDYWVMGYYNREVFLHGDSSGKHFTVYQTSTSLLNSITSPVSYTSTMAFSYGISDVIPEPSSVLLVGVSGLFIAAGSRHRSSKDLAIF